MEKLLIILGIGIVALVLGYLFIKNYNRLDCYFFGRIKRWTPSLKNEQGAFRKNIVLNSAYEPFGRWQVIVSALIGAVCVVVPILCHVFYVDLNSRLILLSTVLLLVVIISFNLYEAIVRMPTAGKRVGKFVFLFVSCAIGLGFGILGSLVVFAAIVLYVVFFALRAAVSAPDLKKGEIMLNDGTILKNKKGLFGEDNHVDSDGNVWDRTGDTFTKR